MGDGYISNLFAWFKYKESLMAERKIATASEIVLSPWKSWSIKSMETYTGRLWIENSLKTENMQLPFTR